jgi:hypothetical protein
VVIQVFLFLCASSVTNDLQMQQCLQQQIKAFISKVTAREKALEASYLVAELNAQKRKSHTVGENIKFQHVKLE